MNLENMNTLIGVIEKAAPVQCIMGRWTSHRSDDECGSAYCVGGWVHALVDQGILPDAPHEARQDESVYLAMTRAVLDISPHDADRLALMQGHTNRLENFDALPALVRKQAMLNVLRLFRDSGVVNWDTAISNAKVDFYGARRVDEVQIWTTKFTRLFAL